MAGYTVVLLRHGESEWNKANRFTGWTDVALSAAGREEARRSGRLLAEAGLLPEEAFTSVLKRAIGTLWLALEELDRMWIPVRKDWRLNERHYGALQGLNKAETAAEHGDEQVHIWRRSYDIRPPALRDGDERLSDGDARYAALGDGLVPRTECLKDTVARVLPYWEAEVVPVIRTGRLVLIAAHGNSLRALVKHLDGMGDDEIVGLNIPTGMPLVYELDAEMRAVSRRYLGDPEAVRAAEAAVAAQGKSG